MKRANPSVVLITGCSSGFGMLTAARLAAAGHTVYASMRDLGKQQQLLDETERRGGQVQVLELDVTGRDSIKAAIERIDGEVGRLDVLINNAGYGIGGFFEDLSEAEIRAQFETNFFGAQAVTRAALPLLRKTAQRGRRAKLINVSSIQGLMPTPGLGAYSASKFALEAFSESLHFELQPFGVDVVLVEPGAYRTPIFTANSHVAARAGSADSPYTPYARQFQERIVRLLKSGKGMGDAEDVARLMERIVEHPRPKLRYLIGKTARRHYFARRILPFRTYRRLLLRAAFGRTEAPVK